MSELDDRVRTAALEMLNKSSGQSTLNSVLRLLARHRAKILQNTIVSIHGIKVQAGPFQGMVFSDHSTEGCFIPKILGCYEAELHPFVEEMRQNPYDTIINVGCAEGYYATGFKRVCPNTRVIARDTDSAAQASSKAIAERNGLSLEIGGEVSWADFELLSDGRTLVWCDIEGGEGRLLDPEKAPKLREVDLVVECHGSGEHQLLPIIVSRFEETHTIEILRQEGHVPQLPDFFNNLGHLDQLLAQWEFRSIPTPWVIARANRNSNLKDAC